MNLDYTSDSGVMADDVQVRVDIGDGLRVTPPDEFVADESQPGTYQLRAPTALTHRDHKTYPWKVEAVSQAYSSHINVDVTTSTPGVLTHGNYADVDVGDAP